MILQKEVILDQACLDGIKTFPNGCNFRLVSWADNLFLEYGCCGVHRNLVQGAERLLMNYLEDRSNPFQKMADIMFRRRDKLRLLDISPETKIALLDRRPCAQCGGTRFYRLDAPFPEWMTQGGKVA